MNGCLLFRTWLILLALAPCVTNGQNGSMSASYSGEEKTVNSNVPLNEINTHAYRHFLRLFPGETGEYWYKSPDGYLVSFVRDGHRCRAHFDARGAYLYSLKYYSGSEASRDLSALVYKKYPGYSMNVVTEITDGVQQFCLVKILNTMSVKTLCVSDGRLDLIEDLDNGAGDGIAHAG